MSTLVGLSHFQPEDIWSVALELIARDVFTADLYLFATILWFSPRRLQIKALYGESN